jgi:ribose transport system ATP-binding protein
MASRYQTQVHDHHPRLRVESLTKSFFGVRVLHGVSFHACGGRVLGVVGENGSGKSTTMNVLTGVIPRDSGEVLLDGEPFAPASRRESDFAGIAFIQQELNIFPNLSVAENLFLVRSPRHYSALPFIARRQMHDRALRLLENVDLDVPPDVSAGTLSVGERQLLEIARGLSTEARVLILDEPTSSLTAVEAERLFGIVRRLAQRGAAIIFISHDLDQVLKVSDEIVVLRDGRVTLSGAAASLTASDLVLAMVGRPIESQFPARAAPSVSTPPVLDVKGLSEPGALRNIHLQVARGEILGIAGLMGSGRSELARAIFALDRYTAGTVRVDGNALPSGDVASRLKAGVAFLTEDRRHEGLLLDATVGDNLALTALPQFASSHGGIIHRPALLAAIEAIGQSLGLKSGDLRTTPVRALSGGNQQKVVLGRWLLTKPKVFILDEPTRGVDVGAKQDIYRLLARMAEAGMGMLVISSELEELLGLCDRIAVMRRGELNATFDRAHFDREAILRAAFGQGETA